MSQQPFAFKQFTVAQDQCAMKIGTDGVLLGAWTSLSHKPSTILDIGAGTGVISLQMAQRSFADSIDAIEIDAEAHEQCTHNFEQSPWADRLFCYHATAQEFASEIEEKYDLIISNPPYFEAPNKENNQPIEAREKARFTDTLPFQHLAVCAAHLLSEKGIFTVILPKQKEKIFVELAQQHGLFLNRVCNVRGTSKAPIKRCLLEFSATKNNTITEELIIEITRHQYTADYIKLVQDFYLKM
jgi:tRNA1Val (adenine37-N6)-methyltransferase